MACRWGLAAQFVQLLTHVHTLHVVALRQATSACYLTTRNYDEDGKELTAEVGCQNLMLAEATADTRRSTGKPTMRRNRLGEGFHGSWKATSTRSSGAQLHVAHSHIVSRKLSRTTTTAQMAHGAYSFLNSLRIDFGQSAGMLANTCRYKNTMRTPLQCISALTSMLLPPELIASAAWRRRLVRWSRGRRACCFNWLPSFPKG